MRNVTVKQRGKRTQRKVKVRIRERERGGWRERDRHGDGGMGGSKLECRQVSRGCNI